MAGKKYGSALFIALPDNMGKTPSASEDPDHLSVHLRSEALADVGVQIRLLHFFRLPKDNSSTFRLTSSCRRLHSISLSAEQFCDEDQQIILTGL